jgi:hypothetical protein
LSALPDSATEGISRIRLSLGREYLEETNDEESPTRDPFTGRISCERFPGVYCGPILGTYKLKHGVIDLHAYVFDPNRLPMPRVVCEFYLRLHALKTLVHEVAHYHDELNRTRRGRWLMDRKENNEWYAEKMEHQWTVEIVVPYLARTYSTQAEELRMWVNEKGGILLPLESFVRDCRTTEVDPIVQTTERVF